MDLIRGQIQFRNIYRARIRGIEANTNLTLPMQLFGVHFASGLQASLTAMDHEDLEYHEPLVYRPKLLSTLKISLNVARAQLQMDYRYASRIAAVKIYPINDRVPMKFVDVRAAYTIGNFTLQLGINNLLNYNYAPMESNLLPMRTYTAGLRGDF